MRLHAGDVVKHFKRETLSQEEQENPNIKQEDRFELLEDKKDE